MNGLKYNIKKEINGKVVDFHVEVSENKENKMLIKYSINGSEMYNAEGIHPYHKALVFYGAQKINGKKINGFVIPESIFNEIKKFENDIYERLKEREEREINDIKTGKTTIKAVFKDGEYLQAYIVTTVREADMLEEIGVAEYIPGWGTKLDSKLVEHLGTEFTYPQVLEYIRPELEKKKEKKEQQKLDIEAKFEEAARTGKPVVLNRWSEPCDSPHEDCDIDNVILYAMPDGSEKVERHHTW